MPTFAEIFPIFPSPLRAKLENTYGAIKRNYYEGEYEPAELNAAKFCEVVFRILEWHTQGSFTPLGTRISNFGLSVKKFEPMTSFNDSVRFHIPKILDALYGIRNRRGVGHVGGDVDPNFMDSQFVVSGCDWVMAELVRMFHGVSTDEARKTVQSMIAKKIPLVWEVGGVRRVLNPRLSYREKALVLLYGQYPDSLAEETLCEWVEHSNPSVFRRDVIVPMHRERLLEFDSFHNATLSPTGVQYVEDNIPLTLE